MVAKHVTLNTTEQKNGNRGMAMVARCVILEAEMKFMKQSGCFLQKLTQTQQCWRRRSKV